MGGDKVSARNAGIPTDRLTMILFVLSSTSCRICGHVPGDPLQLGAGGGGAVLHLQLDHRRGGGRSALLTGGFGSVVGIFFGTITFAVVTQGIYYTDFDRNWSSLIIGVLLLGAVLMNNTFRKMALSYAPKKGAK